MLNLQWYNTNEQRNYPLAESASGLTIDGQVLPDNVLCDLRIHFPYSYVDIQGDTHVLESAYVSSVTIADDYAAISICSTQGNELLASAQIQNPEIGIPYSLVAIGPWYLVPKISGWVVFGNGIHEPGTYVFNDPSASELSPHACNIMNHSVLRIVSATNSAQLSGVVRFVGIDNIIVRTFGLNVDGLTTQAVGIGLDVTTDPPGMLLQFAGPCSQRPSEGTCRPQLMEYINGVGPDEDGNIVIEFPDTFIVNVQDDESTIVLDSNLSLDDVCEPFPVDEDGNMIDDPQDLCEESSSSEPESSNSSSV